MSQWEEIEDQVMVLILEEMGIEGCPILKKEIKDMFENDPTLEYGPKEEIIRDLIKDHNRGCTWCNQPGIRRNRLLEDR